MPWAVAAAGISAVGSIAGGVLGGNAAKSAAGKAASAQQQGLDFVKQVYGDTTGNLQPYMNTGTDALSRLAGAYGLPGGDPGGAQAGFDAFQATPGFQFQQQQGLLAANRGLAAQGLTGSGGQAKALEQYGQGLAGTQFGGYLDQLAKLAGIGQSSAVSLGGIGTQTAGQVQQGQTNIGNAQSAGILGANNAMNQGLSNGLGALGSSNVVNALQSLSGSSYGGKSSNQSGV